MTEQCFECEGRRRIGNGSCPTCRGTGEIIIHSHMHRHGDLEHYHAHPHPYPHHPSNELVPHEHTHRTSSRTLSRQRDKELREPAVL